MCLEYLGMFGVLKRHRLNVVLLYDLSNNPPDIFFATQVTTIQVTDLIVDFQPVSSN